MATTKFQTFVADGVKGFQVGFINFELSTYRMMAFITGFNVFLCLICNFLFIFAHLSFASKYRIPIP
jgi:hypothetical protein